MSDRRRCCIRCGNSISETHTKAGYARETASGLICPLCLTRERRTVRELAEHHQDLDVRRAGWIGTSFTSGAVSFWFLSSASFFDVGVGMFFLVVTTCLVFIKVFEAQIL